MQEYGQIRKSGKTMGWFFWARIFFESCVLGSLALWLQSVKWHARHPYESLRIAQEHEEWDQREGRL